MSSDWYSKAREYNIRNKPIHFEFSQFLELYVKLCILQNKKFNEKLRYEEDQSIWIPNYCGVWNEVYLLVFFAD
jgi:hypothetical protein